MNNQPQTGENPKVTVLMSVYNGERYLRAAIGSILKQTFRDFEFLIVNDGSTDSTTKILESYNDYRIKIINNEKNIGLTKSLNEEIAIAQGKYIARMDADDLSLPERLEKQVAFLEEHPEVGILGCGFQVVSESGDSNYTILYPSNHNLLRWRLCFSCPIAHPSVMMRTAILRLITGYNTDMRYAADYDLWIRLSGITKLSNLQEVLLLYRQHEDTVSQKHYKEQRKNTIRISQLHMSEILGEDVPLSLVQRFWDKDFETSAQVRQTAQLIYKLWKATNSNSNLLSKERRLIRKDAALQLYQLARPRLRDTRVLRILGWALRLDCLLLCRVIKNRMHRQIRDRLAGQLV